MRGSEVDGSVYKVTRRLELELPADTDFAEMVRLLLAYMASKAS